MIGIFCAPHTYGRQFSQPRTFICPSPAVGSILHTASGAISSLRVSVAFIPSFIFARVSYHGHFREHGHYRGQNTPYNRRPWIFTALSLRFNEALTYREIAEQLNISSSAIHKMFTRFRRTGINWPLPEEYTPERLEEELYAFNLETNLPVKNAARTGLWNLKFTWRI